MVLQWCSSQSNRVTLRKGELLDDKTRGRSIVSRAELLKMLSATCVQKKETSGDNNAVLELRKTKLVEGVDFDSDDICVRVIRSGICTTDLQILAGYLPFEGILGHEFVGVIANSPPAESGLSVGSRVVADINLPCGLYDCRVCSTCSEDNWSLRREDSSSCSAVDRVKRSSTMSYKRNHCPSRKCIGIHSRPGCHAEYVYLPADNLWTVPEGLSDMEACFAELVGAAMRIPEQGLIDAQSEVLQTVCVIGDGRLGLLVAEVLSRLFGSTVCRVTICGRHPEKMKLAAGPNGEYCDMIVAPSEIASAEQQAPEWYDPYDSLFDVVVDCTGQASGLSAAVAMCRSMGTVVLKTTCAGNTSFPAWVPVVKELRLVGSRCGPTGEALQFMLREKHRDPSTGREPLDLSRYLDAEFPLEEAVEAFRVSGEKGRLKVQLVMPEPGEGGEAGLPQSYPPEPPSAPTTTK